MTPLEIARLAEYGEARAWADLVRAAPPPLREALGLRLERIGGGVAVVLARAPSLLCNRAFGFGLERPIEEAELEAMIALYRRDAPFAIQPSPEARPAEIRQWLDRRGLPSPADWVCWVREAAPPAEVHTALRVERAAAEQADAFVDLVFRIFHQPRALAPLFRLAIGRRGWSHYLAWDGEQPVAVAALYVEAGTGWLGWGGTLQSHRGRGAQSALIARRARDAAVQGAGWLTSETVDDRPEQPNPSFHNLRRLGFQLAYRRPSHAHFPAF